MYENVDINKQFFLKDLLNYKKNDIDSKKILDSKICKIVFFAFSKNKELELFNENEETMIIIVDGVAKLTIKDQVHILTESESIILTKYQLYTLYGIEKFKAILITKKMTDFSHF